MNSAHPFMMMYPFFFHGGNLNKNNMKEYGLLPGEIIVAKGHSSLVTTVGQGLCVILWNRIDNIGGMNHFLEPETGDDENSTATYGNVAMCKLISMMRHRSTTNTFVARIFGGFDSGEGSEKFYINFEIARYFLWRENIPIIDQDIGGNVGREISFNTSTGQCDVTKMQLGSI